MTDTTNTLHAPFVAWRESALADGWTEIEGGVWGPQAKPLRMDPRTGQYALSGERNAGDNTMNLVKDDMIVWLVDRIDARGRREIWTSGWFQKGLHAMPKVPEVYDPEVIEESRGCCMTCGVSGDPKRLKPLGFAGRVCSECDTPARRAEVEFPGWAD